MNSDLVATYSMNCRESGSADVKISGVVSLGQGGCGNFSEMCYFCSLKIENKKLKNSARAISFLSFKLSPYPLSYTINSIVLFFNFCFNQSLQLRSKVNFLICSYNILENILYALLKISC